MLGKQPGSRAFSLMEILIAIGIIIIFITLPVLAFSNYSKNSRDQKRKSDILKVSQALEQYKAQKGTYPVDLNQLVTEGFLSELPEDPKDGQQIPGEADGITYGYAYETDGTSYELSTRLEQDVNGRRSGTGNGNIANVTGLSGTFTATTGTATGQNVTGTVTIAGTVNESGTTMTSGTLSGPVSGAGVAGTINVSLENIPTTGGASGSVTGTCSVQGTVTGSVFSAGEIISCTINGVGPSAPGPGVFIVTPDNPGGDENPIPELTLIADAEPTAPIPTNVPFVSPTSGVGASITPIPCNQTIVCTGPCQPIAGRCAPASYASTQSGCNYTTRSGSTNCGQVAAPAQACSISSQSCSSPLICVGTYCLSPTPTPTNTPTNTPTRTPTPTPRLCWGINGVCDAGCNVSNTVGTSHVYSTCSINTCWNEGGLACANEAATTTFKDQHLDSSNCSAGYFGKYFNVGGTPCSGNGTGTCYRVSGTWITHNFTTTSTVYKRTYPGLACTVDFNTLPGGAAFVINPATAVQCSWSSIGACGTTLSNRFGVQNGSGGNVYGTGSCNPSGSGQCLKLTGFLGTGTDPFNNTNNCTTRNYYSGSQFCTWYAN